MSLSKQQKEIVQKSLEDCQKRLDELNKKYQEGLTPHELSERIIMVTTIKANKTMLGIK